MAAVRGRSSNLLIRYRYGTSYHHSSNAQILNPLVLFGFRGVGVDVSGFGRLEICEEERSHGVYEAECVVKMRRSAWIWGYPSESELRRRALAGVRQLIEAEMLQDRSKLKALSAASSSVASEPVSP